jgi:hypothetical protein
MKFHRHAVALAIGFLVVMPATAASSSSASIGPLTVQFFDLDPMDGVAPAIVFARSNSGAANHAGAFAYQSGTVYGDSRGVTAADPWAPEGVVVSLGVARAAAAIVGPGTFDGTTLSASGSSADFTSAIQGYFAQYSAIASAPDYLQSEVNTRFTLSAHSVVVISAHASVDAAVTSHVNGQADFAKASAYMSIGGVGGGGGGTQSSSDLLGAGYGAYLGDPFSETGVRLISVSFVNNTGGDLRGEFHLTATAFGATFATPVPEPQTCALTLAGLFALGGAVRRRRA